MAGVLAGDGLQMMKMKLRGLVVVLSLVTFSASPPPVKAETWTFQLQPNVPLELSYTGPATPFDAFTVEFDAVGGANTFDQSVVWFWEVPIVSPRPELGPDAFWFGDLTPAVCSANHDTCRGTGSTAFATIDQPTVFTVAIGSPFGSCETDPLTGETCAVFNLPTSFSVTITSPNAGPGDLVPTPIPAAFPIYAGGLAIGGLLLGWRRKRKAANL